MLVALTGGTGGAKLIHGLSLESAPEDLLVLCNTADDCVLHGLHISPDLDTITYTLAGWIDAARGWGIKDDTFAALEWLAKYGGEDWFQLGDRDLALHITRSRFLREGRTLTEVTDRMRRALGVKTAILPMSNDRIETRVVTPAGEISFQDYFVRRRWTDEVKEVFFAGAEKSRPAPGVLEAIREASAVVVCPSNPVTSIGPILAVPGIRGALKETKAAVVAISPIIGRSAFSGPADRLMKAAGYESSAVGVAKAYADFLDKIMVAPEDAALRQEIAALGVETEVAAILMDSLDAKRGLARAVLALVRKL